MAATHKLVVSTLGSVTTRTWIRFSDGLEETNAAVLADLEASLLSCEEPCNCKVPWCVTWTELGVEQNRQVYYTIAEDGTPSDGYYYVGTVATPYLESAITSLPNYDAGSIEYTPNGYCGGAAATPGGGSTSQVTATIPGNRIATHDDGNGTLVDIDESITTMVPDGAGGLNYTSEDGTVVNIPAETVTTLVPDGAGGLNYTNEDGDVVNIPGQTTSAVTNVIAGHRIGTHDDGDGNLVDIDETITTMVNNGDGTFTYTNEEGTPVTLGPCDAPNDGDLNTGDEVQVCGPAGPVTKTYNPGAGVAGDPSQVTATIPGHRIATHDDGDGNLVDIDETITTMVNNNDGTFTYTNEDGVPVTIGPCDAPNDGGLDDGDEVLVCGPAGPVTKTHTSSQVTDNNPLGDVIATHEDGSGNTVTVKETPNNLVTSDDDSIEVVGTVGANGQVTFDLSIEPGCGIQIVDNVISLDPAPMTVRAAGLTPFGANVGPADWIAAGVNVDFAITDWAEATITNTHPCRDMMVLHDHIVRHLQMDHEGASIIHVNVEGQQNLNGGGWVNIAMDLHQRFGSTAVGSLHRQVEQGSQNFQQQETTIGPGDTLQVRTRLTSHFEFSLPEPLCLLNGPRAQITLLGLMI